MALRATRGDENGVRDSGLGGRVPLNPEPHFRSRHIGHRERRSMNTLCSRCLCGVLLEVSNMSSTQPGPEFRGERLLPHLYRVFAWNSMPEEVFCCDVYAISHPEGVVLVDVGDQRPRCAQRIYENLAAQGLRPEEVTHALLPPYHID